MTTAIITGAAGAIGKAVAKAMIADGWQCALVDIVDAVHNVAADLGASGHVCDVTNTDQRADLMEAISAPKALVNSAGIGRVIPILETSEEDWRQIIDVNLTSTFMLSQAVAGVMAENGGGSIVNIASVSGIRASVGRVAYGTSKAGMIHMTKQFSSELAYLGIRCNAVAPGPVESPMAQAGHPSAQVTDYLQSIPQHRYAQVEEIASSVAFLNSDKALHITGQCLAVDGGWTPAGVRVAANTEN